MHVRIVSLLILASVAYAETWAPLEESVDRCSSIVSARASVPGNGAQVRIRILETWRGKWRGDDYVPDPKLQVVDGQQVVLFFQQPGRTHIAMFPVVDGKVLYASVSFDEPVIRKHLGL